MCPLRALVSRHVASQARGLVASTPNPSAGVSFVLRLGGRSPSEMLTSRPFRRPIESGAKVAARRICASTSDQGQAEEPSSSSLLSSFMSKYNDAADPASARPPPPRPRALTRDDVQITFARSSGAGGQNVNKVNTKVDMRLPLGAASAFLDVQIIEALRVQQRNRINASDELVVTSQRTRSQLGNIEDALDKMQGIVEEAYASCLPVVEDAEKKKAVAKQLEKGNKKRLEAKKQKSDKKKGRREGKNVKDW